MTSIRRALVLLLLAALTSWGALATASANAPQVYHQSDSGRTVSRYPGEQVKVDLVAATGTPCSYRVRAGKHSTKFTIENRSSHAAPHAPGVTGYPYHTVWTLRTTNPGTGTFKVVLVCGAKNKVAKRFVLKVHTKRPPIACGRAARGACPGPTM